MKRLEMVYLMNVLLYLDIEDVPSFIMVCKKCKDTIESIHTNPWGRVQDERKSIEIIKNYFINLQTIQIPIKVFLNYSEVFNDIDKINVIDTHYKTPFICEDNSVGNLVNRINISKWNFLSGLDKNENILETIIIDTDYIDFEIFQNGILKAKNLKRIIVKDNTIINNKYLVDYLKCLSNSIKIMIEIETPVSMIDELLNNNNIYFIDRSLYYPLFLIQNKDDISNIPQQLMNKYYCEHIVIDHNSRTIGFSIVDFREAKSIKKVEFIDCNYNSFLLPESTEKINMYCPQCDIVSNWNELIHLKNIVSNDTNYIPPSKIQYDHCFNKQYMFKKSEKIKCFIPLICFIASTAFCCFKSFFLLFYLCSNANETYETISLLNRFHLILDIIIMLTYNILYNKKSIPILIMASIGFLYFFIHTTKSKSFAVFDMVFSLIWIFKEIVLLSILNKRDHCCVVKRMYYLTKSKILTFYCDPFGICYKFGMYGTIRLIVYFSIVTTIYVVLSLFYSSWTMITIFFVVIGMVLLFIIIILLVFICGRRR